MKYFFSIPIQLVGVILAVVLFGNHIPLEIVRTCYTFSLFFKELLGIILPFMVYFFVTVGILSFRRKAPVVLALLLTTVFFSNALIACVSYAAIYLLIPFISCNLTTSGFVPIGIVIEPWFPVSFSLPINGVHALVAALISGIFFSVVTVPSIEQWFLQAKKGIEFILNRFFIPLLSLYVLGFLLKIRLEGLFTCLVQQYGSSFGIILMLQFCSLTIFYWFAASFSLRRAWHTIRNAFPGYIAAFSTMSSAAAIPISITSAEKNTGNKELSAVAMPIMANVHLLGDSIITSILSMVTMMAFFGTLPSLSHYLTFVFYFCTSMFAVSGIPGGCMLVMIPILKSQFGFNAEMISIIMTMYFLLDSFGTGANVMGDGALVIILHKMLRRLGIIAN